MPTPRVASTVPATVLATILAVAAGGCSFVFVDGPPLAHRKMPFFECSSSITLPTIDLVVGGIGAINAASQLSDTTYGSREAAIVAAGQAVLFTASAIYGYGKTSQCREAKTELLNRMMRNPPPPYGAPAYPAPYQPPYDPWLAPPPGAYGGPPPPAPGVAPSPWGPPTATPVPGPASPSPSPPASVPPPAPAPPAPPAKTPPAADDEMPRKAK